MVKNIEVRKCDITTLDIDIIVNAANKSLLGGGGVDGQIHRKAGSELLKECASLFGCETGGAKMTNAYKLPCKKIIHAVGPVYRDGEHGEDRLLSSCYKKSIDLAEEYRLDNNLSEVTIAFPCISTGVYRYPKDKAAKVVIDTLNEINRSHVNVILACFENEDYEIYKELLNV